MRLNPGVVPSPEPAEDVVAPSPTGAADGDGNMERMLDAVRRAADGIGLAIKVVRFRYDEDDDLCFLRVRFRCRKKKGLMKRIAYRLSESLSWASILGSDSDLRSKKRCTLCIRADPTSIPSAGRKRKRGVDKGAADESNLETKRRRKGDETSLIETFDHAPLRDLDTLKRAVHARFLLACVNLFAYEDEAAKTRFLGAMTATSQPLTRYLSQVGVLIPWVKAHELLFLNDASLLGHVIAKIRALPDTDPLSAFYRDVLREKKRPFIEVIELLDDFFRRLIREWIDVLRLLHKNEWGILAENNLAVLSRPK